MRTSAASSALLQQPRVVSIRESSSFTSAVNDT